MTRYFLKPCAMPEYFTLFEALMWVTFRSYPDNSFSGSYKSQEYEIPRSVIPSVNYPLFIKKLPKALESMPETSRDICNAQFYKIFMEEHIQSKKEILSFLKKGTLMAKGNLIERFNGTCWEDCDECIDLSKSLNRTEYELINREQEIFEKAKPVIPEVFWKEITQDGHKDPRGPEYRKFQINFIEWDGCIARSSREFYGHISIDSELLFSCYPEPKADYLSVQERGGVLFAEELGTKPTITTKKRVNQLHKLIEETRSNLIEKGGNEPSNDEVWNKISMYDYEEILQEITLERIYWISRKGNEQKMQRRTFDNVLSKLRKAS